MTVLDIYRRYDIPGNLEKHMLRVAAVSRILTDHWHHSDMDQDAVVTACLLHDMANIIKFRFDRPPLFREEASEQDYWRQVRERMVRLYGDNVHHATLTICREIGIGSEPYRIISEMDWRNVPAILAHRDYPSAIAVYSDMRVGPHGVMSLSDRIGNLQSRNPDHDLSDIPSSAVQLETTLRSFIAIDPSHIDDTKIAPYVDSLSLREFPSSSASTTG